nr:hypothetical protein [Variovorax paradoxus]
MPAAMPVSTMRHSGSWRGNRRIGRDVLDARSQRLHEPKPRHPGEQAMRRKPADGRIDLVERAEVFTQAQVDARMGLAEGRGEVFHVQHRAQDRDAGRTALALVVRRRHHATSASAGDADDTSRGTASISLRV